MIKHNQLGCLCLCFCVQDRRVEITGPTDRKMVINALNRCGAGGVLESRIGSAGRLKVA